LKKNLATKRKTCFVHAHATLLSLQLHPKTEKGKNSGSAIEIYNNFGDVCLLSEYIPPKKSTKNFFLSFFLSFPFVILENKGLDVNVLREQFPSQ
jgi:hypothetical protein